MERSLPLLKFPFPSFGFLIIIEMTLDNMHQILNLVSVIWILYRYERIEFDEQAGIRNI